MLIIAGVSTPVMESLKPLMIQRWASQQDPTTNLHRGAGSTPKTQQLQREPDSLKKDRNEPDPLDLFQLRGGSPRP